MALFIPHRCPKCFESVTLIQPQYRGGAFKGPAKGQCLNCMDEQEYDLTIPANREGLLHAIEAVTPKADVRLTASIGRNRPKADLEAETVRLGEGTAITNILETRRKAIEIQDHEGRISALEAKNK